MGFRSLRVINDDKVEPHRGFGMHAHRDMEIITWVLEGALAHKDSLGNGETLRPGEVQVMTAGTGIRHSEFNPSDTQRVHLYQIWIQPRRAGLTPAYAQRSFDGAGRRGAWQVVASGSGAPGALAINADAEVMLATLAPGESVERALGAERHAWLQVLRGVVEVGGRTLREGDGAAISDEATTTVKAVAAAELMLFDLA
jgi:redox-sensitive bicupin YhaK (pirin superfamily)